MVKRSKAGRKHVRITVKRKARNLKARLAIKKAIKEAGKAIAEKTKDIEAMVKKAISVLDNAAQRGIIHRNKAARKKSRLMLKANQIK